MFVYWPWVGLIAVSSVIVAVLVIKLAGRCGVRMTTLPARSLAQMQTDGNQMLDNFEVLDDGTINYNLQTMPAGSEYAESYAGGYPGDGGSVVGGYPASQGGYDPSLGGGYNPSAGGGYPASDAGYNNEDQDCAPPSTRQSSRHEYAI